MNTRGDDVAEQYSCLLDYADTEFTRDTAESVPRARILYTTALDLLGTIDLKQNKGECETLIGTIDIEVDHPHWVPPDWMPRWHESVNRLRAIGDPARLAPAVQQIKTLLVAKLPWKDFFEGVSPIITEAETASAPKLAALAENRLQQIGSIHSAVLAQPEVAEAAVWVVPAGPFGPIFVPTITYDFCVPPNPVLNALRLRAELNLYKIRTCRNIAGMERQLEPYVARQTA